MGRRHRNQGWLKSLLGTVTVGLVSGGAGAFGGAIPSAHALCPSQLPDAIAPILNRAEFDRARWGIAVQPLATHMARPVTLYANEGADYFVPASNVKLFTTAAALAHLGPGFRTHTLVYGLAGYESDDSLAPLGGDAFSGDSPGDLSGGASGVASGAVTDLADVRVVGQGDPTLTTARLLELTQQLKDRGIERIDRLVIDDRYFRGSPFNPTWEWEDVQSGYGAPVNSLILNQNEIVVNLYPQSVGQPLRLVWVNPSDSEGWQVVNRSITVSPTEPQWIRVGRDFGQPILYIDGQLHPDANRDISAVSIPKPTEYFGQQLRAVLNQQGISVASVVIESNSAPVQQDGQESWGTVLASLPSLPMAEWLQAANQDSNNLATESLLLQLGAANISFPNDSEAEDAARETTLGLALAQVSETLSTLGIDATGYSLADGSGLSRRNLVSPMSLVETLQAMAVHPLAETYRESLAIAATSGTLRYRFRDTPVAGNLYGKSGGLTGVASLSGYLYPPNYPPLVFSIMVNHSTQSGRTNRRAIDDIVLQLAALETCE